MPTFIALLRAVNLGARVVKMDVLRECVTAAGYQSVETHIQTGNLRVSTPMRSAPKLELALAETIGERFGFPVPVLVRTPKEMDQVVAAGELIPPPLPGEPKHYVNFIRTAPPHELVDELHAWESPGERVVVVGRELHYFSTVPMNKSKFDRNPLARRLAADTTSRNWNVVRTLAAKWGHAANA